LYDLVQIQKKNINSTLITLPKSSRLVLQEGILSTKIIFSEINLLQKNYFIYHLNKSALTFINSNKALNFTRKISNFWLITNFWGFK
jgi:hypothetical protein